MRVMRWGFILFQFCWLNAVVPGHTRGAFAMPGSKPVGASAREAPGGCCASHRTKPEKPDPADKPLDRDRCAVCHYALGLALPPVFSFDHRPAGMIGLVPVPVLSSGFIADVGLSIYLRGPPAGLS